MSKIINFNVKTDNVIDFLENLKKDIKERNIDNIVIVCKDKRENEVLTGYVNLDMGEKQELLGHIQADIIDTMIKANYVTPN